MTAGPGCAPVRDIASREDIAALVTAFYGRAFADPLLGPIFVDVARLDLAAHLPIMCDFWETVLFRAGTYHRNALRAHAALHARSPLTPPHFARWLELWAGTIDDLYQGELAERAKLQATRIAGSLRRRLAGEPASELVTISRRHHPAEHS
ncbi:group III truncated hemoglobin [Frankia sp. CNm7]|uniref:Group III truncated hemoglobin n=1 Tax=Frankia nepalensis TaxID=1836974 RepID=A0A937RGZ5_9ACTN|nr:group III truncated hemoglobin [Frankia nepalensis]MBL7501920.1 group III truncated hemoglobin [Frankia nepalensis]MBL7514521.1 group III truncated hemoglobin [Frankia nepalensis]MBL7524193.1 group III truncated hemoglobin [Frankia nepalensis]MBL7628795.1 group III truncated hemoglobin [Frankia nepalensis]